MEQKNIPVEVALRSWQIQVDRTGKLIAELTDEQLLKEIASGKNRGVYLVGHLAAVHDAMPEILGLGKMNYPELQQTFLKSPDRATDSIPTVAELRKIWTAVHERLQNAFAAMTADAWLSRHESMTDAEFEKDPARNKLSVLLNRTNHLSFHFGQLRLLK